MGKVRDYIRGIAKEVFVEFFIEDTREGYGYYSRNRRRFHETVKPIIRDVIKKEVKNGSWKFKEYLDDALDRSVKESVQDIIQQKTYNEAFLDDIVDRIKRKQVQ